MCFINAAAFNTFYFDGADILVTEQRELPATASVQVIENLMHDLVPDFVSGIIAESNNKSAGKEIISNGFTDQIDV